MEEILKSLMRMHKRVKPTNIMLNPKMLYILDELVMKGIYKSRSEIIRFALIHYLAQNHREDLVKFLKGRDHGLW